jgi:hypothetical protein
LSRIRWGIYFHDHAWLCFRKLFRRTCIVCARVLEDFVV